MPSIFPQSNEIPAAGVVIKSRTPSYGRAPIFDFGKGEFKTIDGKVYIGEGIEVLKNWIEKTLRTERYRFPIYSFNYGVTLEELRARNVPQKVLESELIHQITDALVQDARIIDVGNFRFSRSGSLLGIEFEVVTFDESIVGMEVKV